MHPYSTNSPAPPKHIAFMMLGAVAVSAGIGVLIERVNATFGVTLGGVSSLAVFSGLYLLFDRVMWRWPWVRRVLLVPDLNGQWKCDGVTRYKAGAPLESLWQGTVTIRQSWSRIRIVLHTPQSASHSIAASIYDEPGSGHRLIYHYDNKPAVGEVELGRHCGLCNLLFDGTGDSAVGEYFTDKDRVTAGTMRLTRERPTDAKT